MKQLVTEEGNCHVLRYVMDNEIKEALFKMDLYKVPELDGFGASFFQ